MPDKIQFLCSCPEYLSGTTKCAKKKITCKKCKGIKLPLVPIGGTVRMLPPPIHNPHNMQRYSAATVRLASSSNSSRYLSSRRPTILNGDRDPYDFLRQSRLIYDEPQRNIDPINRNFILNNPNQTNYYYDPTSSPMIIANSFREPLYSSPTKIPYELISSTLHSNEFSPAYDVPSRKTIENNTTNGLKRVQSRKDERKIDEKHLLKQKSILKQSIVPLRSVVGPNDVFRDEMRTNGISQAHFSYATTKTLTSESTEKRNQSTIGIPNNIKQSTISGIRSSKSFSSKNPVNKMQATMIARNKKVQFTETNSESEKESELGQNIDDQILQNAKFIRSQKKGNLRRSMSDRRLPDERERISFKDTTALRPKPIRPKIYQRQSMPVRPSSPPPQLPTTAMKPRSTSVPVRPPRRSGIKKLSETPRDTDTETTSRIFGLLPVSTLNKSSSNGKTDNVESASIQKTLIAVNSEEIASTVEVRDKQKSYRSSVLIAGDNCNETIISNDSSANTINGHQSNAIDRSSNGVFVIKTIAESAANGSATEIKIVYNENVEKNCANSSSINTNCGKTTTLICVGGNDPVNCFDDKVKNMNENLPLEKKKCSSKSDSLSKSFGDGFILKLLSDQNLNQLMQGLEINEIASVIEKSLLKLKNSQKNFNTKTTKDCKLNENVKSVLYEIIKSELNLFEKQKQHETNLIKEKIRNRPRAKSPEDVETETIPIRQLYEILSSSPVWNSSDTNISSIDHQYESISMNCDPIYEEINDIPPPLPLNPPPPAEELKGKSYKPMFLGASKYDILSYLVDAKERGVLPEESYSFKFLKSQHSTESAKVITIIRDPYNDSKANYSSGSDDMPMKLSSINGNNSIGKNYRKLMATIERNDSGVGSETSKISRNKYRPSLGSIDNNNLSSIQLCEDCDDSVESNSFEPSTVMFESIICRKCLKKRAERREILAEFFETEEKYSRDLQIIIDEFYQPMLVAGLLTQEQLSAVFLNIEDLLENSQAFCEKFRKAFYSALEQNDDDLFTIDIGKIMLQMTPMLNVFEEYCTQQAAASLLLANLEKDKELLRIFLRVSQMENTVLRRMNLNSFLMVPVQRVTKYPLLLSRLYKVTPTHLESRERLKDAQEMIESHLNRMNREAKDISSKLWRRLASNQTMQTTRENDIHNIKLRKIVVDLLEWNHEKVYFVVEGKLLVTQPTDNNWRKGRTIKLTPVNALLVTNETIGSSKKLNENNQINFQKPSKTREAALVLVREKSGRYSLFRDPMYLDKCVVCTESEWAEYFEVHEISTKDSFIFKSEDDSRTKYWYSQIQHCAQGTGTWRKRRTALANIMINGMMHRS